MYHTYPQIEYININHLIKKIIKTKNNQKHSPFGKMSTKKHNLTIEIDEVGEQYNSKFKGYVHEVEEVSSKNIYASRASNCSNASATSAILDRAQQILVEERLQKNIQWMVNRREGRSVNGGVGEARELSVEGARSRGKMTKFQNLDLSSDQVLRSKSVNSLKTQQSRAKILLSIAENLQKAQKLKTSDIRMQIKSNNSSRIKSTEKQKSEAKQSRVQRIKQLKEEMLKNRGGKLQHLLKDIKKTNKQAYKVVYSIKKTRIQSNGAFKDQSQSDVKSVAGPEKGKVYGRSQEMDKLADELRRVRFELGQVKARNEQILHCRNKNKQTFNNETSSQVSNITNQLQNMEFDASSNNSDTYKKPLSHGSVPPNLQPSFTKAQPKNNTYYTGTTACFACGCTCRMGKMQ